MEKTSEALIRKIFDAHIQNPPEELEPDNRALLISLFGILLNRTQIMSTFKSQVKAELASREGEQPPFGEKRLILRLTPTLLASFQDTIERGLTILENLDLQDEEMDVSRQSLVALGQKAGPLFIQE